MEQKILDLLRKEGRLPATEIARRLDCDEGRIVEEIQRLEKSHVILGYRAVVNPQNLGEDYVLSLIEVRTRPQRNVGFDAIAARIYRFPEVKTCYLLSGTYDLLLIVEGSSLKEVSRFVSEKLSTLDYVEGTVTHFMLKKYKEDGFVVGGDEELERLPVSP
jgi:DNA-binding Lrp family transcriptional regulator